MARVILDEPVWLGLSPKLDVRNKQVHHWPHGTLFLAADILFEGGGQLLGR